LSISDLKVKNIIDWKTEKLDFANQIGRSPLIIDNLIRYLKTPGDFYEKNLFIRWFSIQKDVYRFKRVYLCDTAGRILISDSNTLSARPLIPVIGESIREIVHHRTSALTELHLIPGENSMYIDLVAPVINSDRSGEHVLGVMVFVIDPRLSLYPLIQSWPVSSATSETQLVIKHGTDVMYLNELRYRQNTTRNFILPGSDPALVAAKAVHGASGIVEGVDYRKVPVLAAIRPVSGTNWYLIAKVDKSEAYAPLRSAIYFSLIISALLILFSGTGLALYGRSKINDVLGEEREQLAVTLRSIGDGVISTNTNGHIMLMNRAAEELVGWKLGEAQGLPLNKIFTIIDATTRKSCENPIEIVLKTGSIVSLDADTVLIRKDGKECSIGDSAAPIKNRQGRIVGVVLVFRDTTDKLRAQENTIKNQKLESVGVLAGGIAHDFNNLLFGIFGYLDMAREYSANNEPALNAITKALTVYHRAQDLTRQLITFSKGGMPVKMKQSLVPVIHEVIRRVLSGSPINSTLLIADDLWNCDVDENQISQVIENIVVNAQQAMDNSSELHVAADNCIIDECSRIVLHPGPYVRITISDSGRGIAPEILNRIFDPFFTTKQAGSGLGLSTSYSIIRKHDGIIDVESAPGKRTSFFIYIPALPKNMPGFSGIGQNSVKKPVETVSGLQAPVQHRILVMDDEDYIRDLATEMLGDMGYEVVVVANGREAVDQVKLSLENQNPFDVLILDLTIPGGMGGKDALHEILRIAPDTRAIASSGYSDDPVMSAPEKFGFVSSLRKPYMKKEIVFLLSGILN